MEESPAEFIGKKLIEALRPRLAHRMPDDENCQCLISAEKRAEKGVKDREQGSLCRAEQQAR